MKSRSEESVLIRGDYWQIGGSGGGGGGKAGGSSGKAPTEDPNTLRSRSDASVMFLLSEGEINGFPSGAEFLKDIYLDDTPIQNPNGSYNFSNVGLDYRSGLQNQTYIPGFSDIEAENVVGVKVTASGVPIVRTLNDANADAIVLRFMTPQLQQITDKGDQRGTSINFTVDIANNGGAFVNVLNASISGKTTSNYERSYRIRLTKPGSWQVRVTRLTPDSNSNKLQNDFYWQSFTSVIETKLSYPNSALLALRISAEQFRSIPKVSMRLQGIKMRIPSNYNPVSRTYSGIWDGTWSYAYTNNPAWVFYDLLTDPRYGAGRYIQESQVDKWSLYQIAQYCDQLVSDGRGGFEPRFTFNAYIQSQDEAYNVLNSLASAFRGMAYWANGSVTATQDAPGTPVRIYNEANVIQEVDNQGKVTSPPFVYSGSSRKARHTVALVSWADPSDRFKSKVEYVEDRDGIALYGYRETQVTAFGCTSRGQAHRLGRWILYSERYETETVTFAVGSDGLLVRPGELIKVADPLRAGQRTGGRILAATATTITLDSPVLTNTGTANPTVLSVLLSNGIQQDRTIVSPSGTQTTVVVSPAFDAAPVVGSPWVATFGNLRPQIFRVISISEKSPYQYTITAIAHNSSKYGLIENNLALQSIPITSLPNLDNIPESPSKLSIVESLYSSGAAGIRTKADINFDSSISPGVDQHQIEYRVFQDPQDFKILGVSYDRSFTWEDARPNTYEFRVCAINRLGLKSDYVYLQAQIKGLNAPPSDVAGLTVSVLNDQAVLRWQQSPDLDVQTGGFFKVKFTPKTSSFSWADGYDVAVVSGASNSTSVPLLRGNFMVKAIDSVGNESVNIASVDTTNAITTTSNTVQNIVQDPVFPGNCLNCSAISGNLQLTTIDFFDARSGLFDDATGNFEDGGSFFDQNSGNFDSKSGFFDSASAPALVTSDGVYSFPSTIDLGAIYTSRISAILSATVVNQYGLFDLAAGDFDSASGLFDGESLSGAWAKLQVSTSNNGTVYSPWTDFTVGDYTARFIRFQLLLHTDNPSLNILVNRLAVTVDMPDRTESGIATTSGATVVNFAAPFWTSSTPVLGITIANGNSGDYYTLTGTSNAGFTVQAFNASGTSVSRSVHWIARGFGRAN